MAGVPTSQRSNLQDATSVVPGSVVPAVASVTRASVGRRCRAGTAALEASAVRDVRPGLGLSRGRPGDWWRASAAWGATVTPRTSMGSVWCLLMGTAAAVEVACPGAPGGTVETSPSDPRPGSSAGGRASEPASGARPGGGDAGAAGPALRRKSTGRGLDFGSGEAAGEARLLELGERRRWHRRPRGPAEPVTRRGRPRCPGVCGLSN